jgi:hypothetical protein
MVGTLARLPLIAQAPSGYWKDSLLISRYEEENMLRFLAAFLGGTVRKTKGTTRPRQYRQTRLGVEELTPRVLLNAGPLGLAGDHFFGHHSHAMVSSSSGPDSTGSSTTTSSSGSDNSGNSTTTSSHTGEGCAAAGATLAADLTNATGATGKALFNATQGTLNVQVKGAAASTSLDIAVNGTTVGTLTTNASGNGHTQLSNVTAQAGSTITVGDLQGTFAQAHFTASLTGATGVTGSADFNTLQNQLKVLITGAAASTTYNVTVNSVIVGQVTTNSSGSGKLRLTPTNVTIQSGSTISVSDTAGDPAILQGTFA